MRSLETHYSTHVVHENVHRSLSELQNELSSIVLLFGFLNATLQIAFERLLTPRAIDGIRDRCECRARAILLRAMANRVQVDGECAVSSHRVSEYRLAREILCSHPQ